MQALVAFTQRVQIGAAGLEFGKINLLDWGIQFFEVRVFDQLVQLGFRLGLLTAFDQLFDFAARLLHRFRRRYAERFHRSFELARFFLHLRLQATACGEFRWAEFFGFGELFRR